MVNNSKNAFDRASQFSSEGIYAPDHQTVFCKFCNKPVTWSRKDSVQKHTETEAHKNAKKKDATKSLQTSVKSSLFKPSTPRKEMKQDLGLDITKTFLKCNIPLEKLEYPAMKNFLDRRIEGAGDLPSVYTLRTTYVPMIGKEHEDDIRAEIQKKPIAVHVDESTDDRGDCVLTVIFRVLEPKSTPTILAAGVHYLENATGRTCSHAILNSFHKYNVQYDEVVALMSDSARYMKVCYNILGSVIGPDLLILYCWDHKLNIVGTSVQDKLTLLDLVLGKLKQAWRNTRKRKHLFRTFLNEHYPSEKVPFFPQPIKIRWGSWFRSAFYLSDHFLKMVAFFKTEEMSSVQNAGVNFIKNLSEVDCLIVVIQAKFVREHCEELVKYMETLEGLHYPTAHTLLDNLVSIANTFSFAERGVFLQQTFNELEKLKDKPLKKRETEESLISAATNASITLRRMQAEETHMEFYKAMSLFSPKNIINESVSLTTCTKLQKICFFSDLDLNTILKGYTALQVEVRKKIDTLSQVDIVQILQGLMTTHSEFARRALTSLWIPCTNVDSERYFSSYNNVLTDKRHNLKRSNTEIMSSIYYENGKRPKTGCET